LCTRANRLGEYAGLAGLAVLFAGALWSPPLLYLAMLPAVAGLVVSLRPAAPAVREPLCWLIVGLVVWVGISGWLDLHSAAKPGAGKDPGMIWDHIRYSGVVPLVFGLWLSVWWHKGPHLLSVLYLGMLVYYVKLHDDIWARVPVGNWNHGSEPELGLIAATGGVLALGGAWRLRRVRSDVLGRRVGAAGILAAVVFISSLVVLLFSQVRAAWLAVLGTTILVGAAALWHRRARRGRAADRRAHIVRVLAGCALLVGALWMCSGYVWERISAGEDLQTVRAIVAGDFGPEYEGSFARRYRILRQGLSDVSAHGLLGVGPASVAGMLEEIAKPDRGQGNYHNTYMNLAVAMGIPWALLWVLVHLVAVVRACRCLYSQQGEIILAYTLAAANLVHFTALLFQVRIWSVSGSALYIILMTLVFGALMRGRVGGVGNGATPAR